MRWLDIAVKTASTSQTLVTSRPVIPVIVEGLIARGLAYDTRRTARM